MYLSSVDLGRDAFEFIEHVQRLSTTGEIIEAMQAIISKLGFQYLCFNFLPGLGQTFEDVLLANRLPPGWLDFYIEQQFVNFDPSIRHCGRTIRPYRWFKESPYDAEREPRALEVVHRARDFGMSDGLVVPVACPTGQIGHVWMGAQTLDLPEYAKAALHLMALYAFDRIRCLQLKLPPEKPRLTNREREVLTWIALGKSSSEIGDILHISNRTVEWHAMLSCQKLGAVNRTQAIAIALRDHLIQP
jgi:LuxR family quorum sensing-dependent transcriptional regulator